MLSLSGKNNTSWDEEPFIARITTNVNYPLPLRSSEALLIKENTDSLPEGFKNYITTNNEHKKNLSQKYRNLIKLSEEFNYLADGDIFKYIPRDGAIKVLYRTDARPNFFLLTERCNNYCVMCSQPPRDINDSYIVNEILSTIPLMSRATKEIVLTGGEPTLLKNDLLKIIRKLKNYLPETAVHILSNGRLFSHLSLARDIAAIEHFDLMIGIPLYSDISNIHDFVVQGDGAFDETIRGIINLKRYNVPVEIRVVLHKATYERLPQLARFIIRNLPFVDHVALMGLEMTGFTKPNINALWIDPIDYQEQLVAAVDILDKAAIRTSIYNHQLCLLDKKLWKFSVKSISDWKNEYMPECTGCIVKEQCGGFFSSAHFKYSSKITPFLAKV